MFLAFTLMDLWQWLPFWLHVAALAAMAAGLVYGLRVGFAGFAWPTRDDAIRRIERRSGLDHRPLASIDDTMAETGSRSARGDPVSRTMWAHYQARLRARLSNLRVGRPQSHLATRDPWATRFVVVMLLLVALVQTGPDLPDRFSRAFNPALQASASIPVSLDAWVNPPAYTDVPPIFLTQTTLGATAELKDRIEIPEGSQFYVRVQGPGLDPEIAVQPVDGIDAPVNADAQFEVVSEDVFEFAQELTASTQITVGNGGRSVGSWTFDVLPDLPPVVTFWEDPSATAQKSLKIPFSVVDDYGVVGARAVIALVPVDETGSDSSGMEDRQGDDSDEPLRVPLPDTDGPLSVDLPLSSLRTQQSTEAAYEDFTSHPWAGLDVTIQLFADDEAGQTGESEILTLVLPERDFRDPLARAVIEQRKWLAQYPTDIMRVARYLDALTAVPTKYYDDFSIYLGLRSAYWRLTHASKSSDLAGLYELLWDIAVRIEDGDLFEMAQVLRDLQRELMEALNDGRPQDEIDKIMEALREAMQQYLAELMRQNMEDMQQGEMPPMDPNAQTMTGQDLQELLDAIEDMLRAGDMEAAAQLLAQLMDMLENIDSFAFQPGQGGSSELNESLGDLGDMIGRQRGLMDESFRESQPDGQQEGEGQRGQNPFGRPQGDQFGNADPRPGGPGGQPGMEPGQEGGGRDTEGNEGGTAERGSGELADDQARLRQELDEIIEGLREQGIDVPNELDRAGRAMEEAQRNLERGDPGGAVDPQKDAIDQLRQGAQSLAQRALDESLQRQGMGNEGDPNAARDYDPLGRPSASAGPDYGDSVRVPTERDRQRARDILEELRRRAGELGRPDFELEYLDRLLKRF